MEGVDYSTDHPDPNGLVAVGKLFACRYGGIGGAAKLLTSAEAQALSHAGVSIVAGVEGLESGLLAGYDEGARWARAGDADYKRCGMPATRPLYLGVDFDCTADQWPHVREALRGAASEIGLPRVGVYGSYDVIRWAQRDDVARWFWQTYAWSHGLIADGIHIYQYRNGVSLVGGTVDLDRAMTVDFGQWKVASQMELTDRVQFVQKGDVKYSQESTTVAGMLASTNYYVLQTRNHVDAMAARLEELHTNLSALSANLDNFAGVISALSARLDDAVTKLDEVASTSVIDPVQVAAAIANRPEIARTLADQVAAQLAAITGSISLSGSLLGRITPPAQ